MNLLIIDDEQIVREGLKTIFPWAEYGFTVCGEAKNGEEGVSLIRIWFCWTSGCQSLTGWRC